MLKKTITYTDFDGNERTDTLCFNLTKAEALKMEAGSVGGLSAKLQRIVDENDVQKIIETFEEIVLKAYGEKSSDGQYFKKSKELSEAFSQTEAYSELFMELATNGKAAAEFMNGIIPQSLNDIK